MDIFEYLPQMIVAYDGNDEFANLIHISKADKDRDYYCPCCGKIVKPRALDSTKEQSHYYHIDGKCAKEGQLHFFCKNWLFEKGSKFYIDEDIYEVERIEIEESHNTMFGVYRPDITVYTTTGKIIYFELFFSNRKTEDDYYCKWSYLNNDVVEINIKEYLCKNDESEIPTFKYLYHDGVCYSKQYISRDLYANTIAKVKRDITRQDLINYKIRIEKLDWFWQKIKNKESEESILGAISEMEYDDMLTCYDIIKRKQCVSYLKNNVLNTINNSVVSQKRKELDLPYDENIYFDLRHVGGRTYEAGIRLNLKTEHIIYNGFCPNRRFNGCDIKGMYGFPKIVFDKNVFNYEKLSFSKKEISILKYDFNMAQKFKDEILRYEKEISNFEKNIYKIRVNNNLHTVLIKNGENFELLLENVFIKDLSIGSVEYMINDRLQENFEKKFVEDIFNDDVQNGFIGKLTEIDTVGFNVVFGYMDETYEKKKGIYLILLAGNSLVYDKKINPNLNSFYEAICECKDIIEEYNNRYSLVNDIVRKINACKNEFWISTFNFDYYGNLQVFVDQNVYRKHDERVRTREKIILYKNEATTTDMVKSEVLNAMNKVLKNMEYYGCRVMEVC